MYAHYIETHIQISRVMCVLLIDWTLDVVIFIQEAGHAHKTTTIIVRKKQKLFIRSKGRQSESK